MKPVLTAKISKENENYTVTNQEITHQDLIRTAAGAVLTAMQAKGYDLSAPCILCGGGNNGADGLALACLLKDAGANVTVLYLGQLYAPPAPTKKNANKQNPAQEIDPALIGTPQIEAMSESCHAYYVKVIAANIRILTSLEEDDAYSVFVDAVYGTGMHGAITSPAVCETFDRINQNSIPVVAVDIPSGVNPDTGAIDAHTLCATQTVTMQNLKPGLLLYPGAGYAGVITVADIGIESDPATRDQALLCIESEDVEAMLPARPARAFKGTFGRVLIVGGRPGMAGAVYMAAAAAYRSGAGLVEILTHSRNRIALQQLLPEAIVTCYVDKSTLKKALKVSVARADAIVLGCGLGMEKSAKIAVKRVLKKAKVPLVIDADALNVIGKKPALLKSVRSSQKAQTVITPHAGEAAKLIGKHYKSARVMADVDTASRKLRDTYKVNVLLKDARTLIRSYDGRTAYINLSGSTALAGAGSGDILAGMIGGLLAAKTNTLSPVTTAALAAHLHGKAGEKAEAKVGARAAMARDVLDALTQ